MEGRPTLTLSGLKPRLILSFLSGAGMIAASLMTVDHFFRANYPRTIWEGSFCDISAFFNCDSSAFSVIAQVMGVPLGYFGMLAGALVVLGTIFPSEAFERTNKTLALLNAIGVVGLFAYSLLVLGTLCLLCTGYYLFAILSFALFAKYGIDREKRNPVLRWVRPSLKLLVVFGLVGLAGALGMAEYHKARKVAQAGTGTDIVRQFFELPKVAWPSVISPYWSVRSTENFEDAAIRIVEYVDFLCPDCHFLGLQLKRLEREFPGKINVAVQFFPLDGACNAVVPEKAGLHPGACELAYIAAGAPERFVEIHDEIWATFERRRDPEWRAGLARKYGTEEAADDPALREMVKRIIDTGTEYERTSEKFSHGIRSTPTMIINNRMIIGTLPDEHMRAIFKALVEEHEGGPKKFIENWVPPVK